MTVDEILADPAAALDLIDGNIPLHVVILCEYARPASDTYPYRNGLSCVSDDDCSPWTSIGMLRFAEQLELNSIGEAEGDPDDDEGDE